MPSDLPQSVPEQSPLMRMIKSPHAAAATAMFMWALSMIAVRLVRGDVPPLGLSFWRTLLALLIVLPFAVHRVRADWFALRKSWPILALLGFLLFVAGNGGLFVGLQNTTAINASLINSFEPILIVVVGALMFRDAVTIRQAIGVAVSLAGVLALISRADYRVLADFDINRGDLWVLFAITSWAFYAVLLRRSPRGVHYLSQFTALVFFGALFMLPFYLWEAINVAPTRANLESISVIAILAVFSTLLSIILWNKAIAGLGSGRAALFIHLIPVYSVILAGLLLDETLELYHAFGIVLIGIGIWLATMRRAR